MVQLPSSLGERANKNWKTNHSTECPGIAFGKFTNAKSISYAVLLVSADQPDKAFGLVVFDARAGKAEYQMRLLTEGTGGNDYFIRTLPTSYFSRASVAKFQMVAPANILLQEDGEKEAGSSIFYWSGAQYKEDSIDF